VAILHNLLDYFFTQDKVDVISQGCKMDIIAIEAMHFDEWLQLWNGYLEFYETSLTNKITQNVFDRISDKNVTQMGGFIAIENGVALGLVHYIIHANTWSDKNVCYLEDLFTTKEARGKGIGRTLIEKVAEYAKQTNCRHVYWQTHNTNKTAQSLYNKVGENTGFIVYKKNW
jgi:GNAT superfamily N-acetyltransferase